LYSRFALKNTNPNFYIIGSKYGDGKGNDTVPKIGDFIKNQCVAIGFLEWADFSEYMYEDKKNVDEFIKENWKETKPILSKMQRFFRLLSQIKPGDIIAIKSHGRFNKLTIIAYAQVVEKNGSVYEYDPDDLGHKIHVEFLDTGFTKKTGLNYSETIHTLKPTHKHFNQVFGWYASQGIDEEMQNVEVISPPMQNDQNEEDEGNAYNKKMEGSYERGPIAAVQVRRIHNEIQNKFIQYLDTTFPNHSIKGEKIWIDAQRETKSEVYIYEIKPYSSVYACVREGIGQLLDYHHQHPSDKQKHILIVGQNEPEDKDIKFIDAVRTNLSIPFKYLAFDTRNLTVTEF
jgi:hypothetical protein